MSQLSLAEISKAVALQDGSRLTIYVEGFTSGFGGRLEIINPHTMDLPPSFFVYALPGNSGINPSSTPEQVLTKNAASFDANFKSIQLHTKGGRIILEATTVVKGEITSTAVTLNAENTPSTGLTATHNLQPGSSLTLKVFGKVMMPTPGYKLTLSKAEPQGINPSILLLNLKAEPPTGIVTQNLTLTPVSYEENTNSRYKTVQIEPGHIVLPVEEIF
jgi:hypothetical protein